MHNLCLEVLAVHGIELCLFRAKAFSPTHTFNVAHLTEQQYVQLWRGLGWELNPSPPKRRADALPVTLQTRVSLKAFDTKEINWNLLIFFVEIPSPYQYASSMYFFCLIYKLEPLNTCFTTHCIRLSYFTLLFPFIILQISNCCITLTCFI